MSHVDTDQFSLVSIMTVDFFSFLFSQIEHARVNDPWLQLLSLPLSNPFFSTNPHFPFPSLYLHKFNLALNSCIQLYEILIPSCFATPLQLHRRPILYIALTFLIKLLSKSMCPSTRTCSL